MAFNPQNQHDRALLVLRQEGIVRLKEFTVAGITASTIARMERPGEIARLGRGLYQLCPPSRSMRWPSMI